MIKPFKIRVENEAHSREIQEYLFEHKVPWYSSGYEVGNTDKPFLFVYPDYGGWEPNITYSRYEESFNDSQLPEKWFYDNKLQDQPNEESNVKLKPFKIKVESEIHSREIQEWLFSLGYKWVAGSRNPQALGAMYLIFSKEREDEEPTISWASCSRFFKESNLPEAWFYDGKLQDHPPSKNTLLEELHSVLDKYDISISLVQDCDNNYTMLLESESDETFRVCFDDKINRETIQEYIDACTFEDVEFESSRLCDPHIVNYLGKDIPVPFTFKRGWLATDDDGEVYVYKEEPELSPYYNIFKNCSTDTVSGIDYAYLGNMNFTAPYTKWKESKLFFDISEY